MPNIWCVRGRSTGSCSYWHRLDNPQLGGMVFCVVQESSPALVWTNQAELPIGLVQGDPQGPDLDQLYDWWKKHR